MKAENNAEFARVLFPSSSNNTVKVITLNTEEIRCLQQRLDCQSSGSVWLNDQVCIEA